MTRPLQVAIFCGATPLTIGSLIYWAWRGTRWHWLEEAGILNIIGGLVLFFVGTICLIWHINHEARSEHKCRRPLTRQSLLVGGLLLVNFPAAALYGLSVIGLMTQYTVRVINESGTTIDSFVLIGPHVHVDVGPIPMGDVKSRSLAFNGDGTLDFSFGEKELQFDGQIEGYVTGNQSGDATIRVLPAGKFEITKTFDD